MKGRLATADLRVSQLSAELVARQTEAAEASAAKGEFDFDSLSVALMLMLVRMRSQTILLKYRYCLCLHEATSCDGHFPGCATPVPA
jgi:hypothetical protein